MIKSFCHLCLAECGINIETQNNKFIKILPDRSDPVSQGYLCEKSQKLINFQHSQDKILFPKKRVDGKYIDISWNQALEEITQRLKAKKSKILYMAPLSPSYNFHTCYSYTLARMLGADYVTNVFSFEKSHFLISRSQSFNCTLYPERDKSDTLLIVGQNPWVTQHYPRARTRLKRFQKDKNKKMIVIDPCVTETAELADLHIKLKPGTDLWLLLGVLKLLLPCKNNNYKNIDILEKKLQSVNLNNCANITGVDEKTFYQLASIIKNSKSLAVESGNGVCHIPHSLGVNYLLDLIILFSNSIGKGMIPVKEYLTNGHMQWFDLQKTPITDQKLVYGTMAGPTVADNLSYFDCVIIDNNNPVTRLPNSKKFKEKLASVDLVIALDSFNSESTKCAEYILPTSTFFERTECVGAINPIEKTLQISRPVLEPAVDSNDILEDLAKRLNLIPDVDNYFTLYHKDRTEFINLIENLYVAKNPILYYVIKYTLGKEFSHYLLAFVWFEIYVSKRYSIDEVDKMIRNLDDNNVLHYDNTNTIDLDNIDVTPKMLFASLSVREHEYEFILQCGYRTKESLNNVIPCLEDQKLEIYQTDADKHNIKENDIITVSNGLNSIELSCTIINTSQPGLLRIKNSQNINFLTNDKLSDYFGSQYKFVPVTIRKRV